MIENTQSISRYFTWGEAVNSQTAARRGIDNTPNDEARSNILMAAQAMDRVRDVLGHPVHVSSWYRSPKLNAAVGGAAQSAHMTGWAVDFECPQFGTPEDCIRQIKASGIPYRKIILEFPPNGWVHCDFGGDERISLVTNDGKNYARAA